MIPNGIDITHSESTPAKPKNPIKLLFTGRFSEQKNLIVFIKALALLEKDFQFKLIGDGPLLADLKSLVHKNNLNKKVIFDTWKDRKSLLQEYRKANIFVLPSLDEGMSNSALEAVINGCPLLSSANAHLQWTDESINRNWVVTDYQNPNSWKEQLTFLLENPAIIENAGKQMKTFIRLNNNWGNLLPKYEKMLKECVE